MSATSSPSQTAGSWSSGWSPQTSWGRGSTPARSVLFRRAYSPVTFSTPPRNSKPQLAAIRFRKPSFGKSLGKYLPTDASTSRGLTSFLSPRLMTPAMASEPYWAEAPSRRTSTWPIAIWGIAFMSTPEEPGAELPKTCTEAVLWRRFPLIRTSAWSGLMPRSWKGRRPEERSAICSWGT